MKKFLTAKSNIQTICVPVNVFFSSGSSSHVRRSRGTFLFSRPRCKFFLPNVKFAYEVG